MENSFHARNSKSDVQSKMGNMVVPQSVAILICCCGNPLPVQSVT